MNFNDVSGRELDPGIEREETARSGFFDWLIGKWFDTFAAMGPSLVTADEIARSAGPDARNPRERASAGSNGTPPPT